MSQVGDTAAAVAIFCDGGLVGPNPSPKGGTYAWCAVAQDGEHVREAIGYVLPNTIDRSKCPGAMNIGSETVSNNDTEFYAALRALEAMPAGWTGILASDSKVTLTRLEQLRNGEHLRTFRMDWAGRARSAFSNLGEIKLKHLAGHPTLKEQADGVKIKKDGTPVPVNRHQQWCDDKCKEWAETYDQRILGWHTYVKQGLLPGLTENVA